MEDLIKKVALRAVDSKADLQLIIIPRKCLVTDTMGNNIFFETAFL